MFRRNSQFLMGLLLACSDLSISQASTSITQQLIFTCQMNKKDVQNKKNLATDLDKDIQIQIFAEKNQKNKDVFRIEATSVKSTGAYPILKLFAKNGNEQQLSFPNLEVDSDHDQDWPSYVVSNDDGADPSVVFLMDFDNITNYFKKNMPNVIPADLQVYHPRPLGQPGLNPGVYDVDIDCQIPPNVSYEVYETILDRN